MSRVNTGVIGVDIFCGAGGLTFGMAKAGVTVRLGIDNDSRCKETYERNNKGTRYWCKDICSVSGNDILSGINLAGGQKFILAACAPCQPFSRQNRKNVLNGNQDERSDLLDEVGRIIREMSHRPDYLFIENVPGIELASNGVFKRFEDMLFELGYTAASAIIDAAKYGVPQHRRRLILMARLGISYLSFPEETHGPGKRNDYQTVEVIGRFPPLKAGGKCKRVKNHQARNLASINLKRMQAIPKNGGSREALRGTLVLECHKRTSGHKDVYGRMSWNEPAPTITTRCVSLSNGRFGHPTQDRAMTVREAAALQTFPDSYVFYGTGIDSQALQVGNAVPVRLAEHLVRHLLTE